MPRSMMAPLLAGVLMLAGLPTSAQDQGPAIRPADPQSPVGEAGSVILHYIGGRTLEEAGGASFNPFGIDGETLLFSVGSFFITSEYAGAPVHEGELSIYPQFATPLGAFQASAAAPAIIPFAFMQGGACRAGYVGGHPVADTVFEVEMTDQICHAAIVEEIAYAAYAAAAPPSEPPVTASFDPAFPADLDLDVAVWAAYNAAYTLAIADGDYLFIRNGDFGIVRKAILAELEKEGLAGIDIVTSPIAEAAAAFGCADPGTTAMRVAFTAGGLGITIVAASSQRMSAYEYDPDVSADLSITYARDCQTSGFGRMRSANVE